MMWCHHITRRKHRGNSTGHKHRQNFLEKIPKAKGITAKTSKRQAKKLLHYKAKGCQREEAINWRGKIFANYATDRGVTFRMYKKLQKSTTTKQSSWELSKGHEQLILKEWNTSGQ